MSDEKSSAPTGFEALPSESGAAMRVILRQALRWAIALTVLVAIVGAVVGWFVAEMPGVWGALMGAALTLVFCGTTIVAMMLTTNSTATTMTAVVVGSWFVKVVVTLALVIAVRDATFYDKPVFVITVFVAVVGTLALDMRAVSAGRMPYTGR